MKNLMRWLSPARTATPAQRAPANKSAWAGGLVALHGGGNAGWTTPDYRSLSRAGYMQNPVVYRCVRMISEAAATVPLLAYNGTDELSAHPALELIDRPNARQGGRDLLETVAGHLLVSGNAYLHLVSIDGTPRELHALRPDRVKVLTDTSGWVEGYEYSAGSRPVRHMLGAGDPAAILHMTLFHPLDDQHGFPPLRAALMALDVHNAASRWNKSLLDNSARPSGALVYGATGSNLSDDQFQRLKQELEEGYSGPSRAGRPLLLEGGLDWKAMGYSPRDMDFMQARNGAARDIALAFGVPPMLLGIPGDNTYANYQEANRAFWRQTVLPLVNRTLGSLSNWLEPHFGEAIRLAADLDQVEGLSAEREALWRRINAASFLTDEEKRESVGYSPTYERGSD